MKVELTAKEWELIATIRNYRKTYPQSEEIGFYIQQLVYELLDENEL